MDVISIILRLVPANMDHFFIYRIVFKDSFQFYSAIVGVISVVR